MKNSKPGDEVYTLFTVCEGSEAVQLSQMRHTPVTPALPGEAEEGRAWDEAILGYMS